MMIKRTIFALIVAGTFAFASPSWPRSRKLRPSSNGLSPGHSENMTRRNSSAASRSTKRSARLPLDPDAGLPQSCGPGGPGFSEAQAAAVAAEYKIKDLDDKGEPVERAGRLAD